MFYGSRMSTYSDYINIIRGYNNKIDNHRKSLNFDRKEINVANIHGTDIQLARFGVNYIMAKFNLGIHGSHNAAVAISYGGDILEVVELERWVQIKMQLFTIIILY